MGILVASNLYPPYYRGGYDLCIEEMKSVLVAPIAESVCLGTTISSSALDVVPGKGELVDVGEFLVWKSLMSMCQPLRGRLPLVIAEAMGLGLPCVLTNIG